MNEAGNKLVKKKLENDCKDFEKVITTNFYVIENMNEKLVR